MSHHSAENTHKPRALSSDEITHSRSTFLHEAKTLLKESKPTQALTLLTNHLDLLYTLPADKTNVDALVATLSLMALIHRKMGNLHDAVKFYLKASEEGHAESMLHLAQLLFELHHRERHDASPSSSADTPPNINRAIALMKRAAQLNHTPAYYYLYSLTEQYLQPQERDDFLKKGAQLKDELCVGELDSRQEECVSHKDTPNSTLPSKDTLPTGHSEKSQKHPQRYTGAASTSHTHKSHTNTPQDYHTNLGRAYRTSPHASPIRERFGSASARRPSSPHSRPLHSNSIPHPTSPRRTTQQILHQSTSTAPHNQSVPPPHSSHTEFPPRNQSAASSPRSSRSTQQHTHTSPSASPLAMIQQITNEKIKSVEALKLQLRYEKQSKHQQIKRLEQSYQNEINELRKSIEEKSTLMRQKEQLWNRETQQLRDKVSSICSELDDFDNLREKNQQLTAEIQHLRQESTQLQHKFHHETNQQQLQFTLLQNASHKKQKESQNQQKQIDTLTSSVQSLKDELNQAQKQLKEAHEKLSQTTQQNDQLAATNQELSKKLQSLQEEHKACVDEFQESQIQEKKTYQEQIRALKLENEQLQAQTMKQTQTAMKNNVENIVQRLVDLKVQHEQHYQRLESKFSIYDQQFASKNEESSNASNLHLRKQIERLEARVEAELQKRLQLEDDNLKLKHQMVQQSQISEVEEILTCSLAPLQESIASLTSEVYQLKSENAELKSQQSSLKNITNNSMNTTTSSSAQHGNLASLDNMMSRLPSPNYDSSSKRSSLVPQDLFDSMPEESLQQQEPKDKLSLSINTQQAHSSERANSHKTTVSSEASKGGRSTVGLTFGKREDISVSPLQHESVSSSQSLVLSELCNVTRLYTLNLKRVNQTYAIPLRSCDVLSQKTVNQLFSCFGPLQDSSSHFAQDLESYLENSFPYVATQKPLYTTKAVRQAVDCMQEYFRSSETRALYMNYANEYGTLRSILRDERANNDQFGAWIRKVQLENEDQPIHRLEKFFSLPVVQVGKYVSLLKRLLMHTERHSNIHGILSVTFDEVRELANFVSRQVSRSYRRELEDLNGRLNIPDLVRENRHLIGSFQVSYGLDNSPAEVHIFNDCCMIGVENKDKSMSWREFPLYGFDPESESDVRTFCEGDDWIVVLQWNRKFSAAFTFREMVRLHCSGEFEAKELYSLICELRQ